MNYYDYHKAIRTLNTAHLQYKAEQKRARSQIVQSIDNLDICRKLLRQYINKYNIDNSIHTDVCEIAGSFGEYSLYKNSARNYLSKQPLHALAHYYFGHLFLSDPSNKLEILLVYLDIIDKEENHSDSLLKVATDDERIGLLEKKFRQSARRKQTFIDYLRLGNFLIFQHNFQGAASVFSRTIQLEPDCSIGFGNLSFALQRAGRLFESHVAMGDANFARHEFAFAIREYVQARSLGELPIKTYEKLAQSYFNEQRYSDAVSTCAEATQQKRTDAIFVSWVQSLELLNKTEEALRIARHASKVFPKRTYFKFPARLILPIIYESEQSVSEHRARFQETLREWSTECQKDKLYAATKAIDDIKSTTFFLPYQGRCVRKMQTDYGQLLNRIMTASYPEFSTSNEIRKIGSRSGSRIRVGYISKYVKWHSVGKLFLGWVENQDVSKFDTYVYYLGRDKDFMTEFFERAASHFYHFPEEDIEQICNSIRNDRLDILVHLDYGMSTFATKVAALRLAPVQCVTWGHPVTSGLPTMDYFISSEMMEPPDGDDHYSEKLVRLANIGVCVPRASNFETRRSRSDYGLSDDKTIYICPHSLFKYMPKYDDLLPNIVKRNPDSEIVFIERNTHSLEATLDFKNRIGETFKRNGLNPEKSLRFIPSQSFQEYMELLSMSDVFLDNVGWSGCLTSLEALGCMLPIVTIPGEYMRGRHSYAFLKQIDVTETIALSLDDYVDIAARLALDKAWRAQVLSKQAANLHKLYCDRHCVLTLEEFYSSVVVERRSTGVMKQFL